MSFATSPSNAVASLIAVLIMAAVHVFVGELRRVNAAFHSAVLMAAAGSSLAYVLVHILPKLADKQEILLSSIEPGVLGYLEHHVYLMAMAKEPAEKVIKAIRRATRKQYSADEKIRIVLAGLRGEDSIAELCWQDPRYPLSLLTQSQVDQRNPFISLCN